MNASNILHYLPFIERMALLIALLWQRENIKDFLYSMLGEPGSTGVSSKRVVLIICIISFVHLCWYVTENSKILDGNILWAHVAIIVTSATIATLPQLGNLIASIKGLVIPNAQAEKAPVKQTEEVQP